MDEEESLSTGGTQPMKKIISILSTVILSTMAISNVKAQDLSDQASPLLEVKIALIGDTEGGSNFGSVLKMVAAEKANALMINGDFGYAYTPEQWRQRVLSSVDINTLPIIATLGNHDVGKNTNTYVSILKSFRNEKNGLTTLCTGSSAISEGHDIIAVDETCTFGNVSIVGSGIGQVLTKPYLESRFAQKLKAVPQGNWKLAGYHFTLSSMNPGLKGDEVTQSFFDLIRQSGAIGAQGHTHSAMASCPISSAFKKGAAIACHPEFKNPEERFILPGTGIFIDSSVGGKEARSRTRCKTANEAGCKHMVDLITKEGYTRTDGVKKSTFNRSGALFIIFNYGGDSNKALAYFKSIDGQIVFKFNISR
jgi:hypothetical protein